MRWTARVALLTLVVQLASLGHWSFGPFHPGIESLASHKAHCHGDSSACGGQPSFVGTYIERPLVVAMPHTDLALAPAEAAPATGFVGSVPHRPPRAA